MPELSPLQALQVDVAAIQQRIDHQMQVDPDHVVALAMLAADLKRAQAHVQRYLTTNRANRTYVDGRRVA